MLVKACGVDLIEIERIRQAIRKERFRLKIYSPFELAYLENKRAQSWAARFAAKEAVMKALGRGWQQGVPFACIEVYADSWGQPQIRLIGKAKQVASELRITDFRLSLSHTRELAMAYVIALGEE